jgi:hypothetical protein
MNRTKLIENSLSNILKEMLTGSQLQATGRGELGTEQRARLGAMYSRVGDQHAAAVASGDKAAQTQLSSKMSRIAQLGRVKGVEFGTKSQISVENPKRFGANEPLVLGTGSGYERTASPAARYTGAMKTTDSSQAAAKDSLQRSRTIRGQTRPISQRPSTTSPATPSVQPTATQPATGKPSMLSRVASAVRSFMTR